MTCVTSCWQARRCSTPPPGLCSCWRWYRECRTCRFLLFSALLGFTGWRMSKQPLAAEAEEKSLETLTRTITETSEQQVSWETIPLIEPISLSLGYKLVALVDKAQG